MAVNLLQAVVNNRTTSINFFNGRLLSGEDLTTEQKANRAAHSLLGQAIGDGVAYGLEVQESGQSSTVQNPVLLVKQGVAINRNGVAMQLSGDTEISLVRPASSTAATAAVFQDCAPVQSGSYIAGAGVYLFTIGPASVTQGLAEVSGISTAQAPCNSKFNADGVQFRLIPINLSLADLNDVAHLRNVIAYRCFGVADEAAFPSDPFGPPTTSFGLIDQLRSTQSLTDCEVPLAVLYWAATSGLVFVDMWSVRRRSTHRSTTAIAPLLTGDRRLSEAEAMFLQFEEQMNSIVLKENNIGTITAESRFQFLPSAGMLPVTGTGSAAGFDIGTFFGNHASLDIATTDGALVRELFHDALYHEPIQLAATGKVQLYLIWENLQAIGQRQSTQLAVVFASPKLRYRGVARFGTAKWTLSRFAPRVI